MTIARRLGQRLGFYIGIIKLFVDIWKTLRTQRNAIVATGVVFGTALLLWALLKDPGPPEMKIARGLSD